MSDSVLMPALGESVTEGTVTRWLKQVGDQVEVDEPLLEVSTDKVDTEIPSPFAGTLTEILVQEDETVEVGTALARIGGADEGSGDGAGGQETDGQGGVSGADGADAQAGGSASDDAPSDTAAGADEQQAAQIPPELTGEGSSEGTDGGGGDQAPQGGTGGDTQDITMPALGESVTEGTVTRWLKQVGDQVEVDEALLEVSTDKVDTEIPSPFAGTLTEIVAAEDETVEVGAVLARIGSGGGQTGGGQTGGQQQDQSEPAPAPDGGPGDEAVGQDDASQQPAPLGAAQPDDVTEEDRLRGTTASVREAPAAEEEDVSPPQPSAAASENPAPGQQADRESQVSSPAPAQSSQRSGGGTASGYLTPLVRKLAGEKGVDLSEITGTGVGGRIRKEDVLEAAAAAERRREEERAERERAEQERAAQQSAAQPSAPAGGGGQSGDRAATGAASPLRGTTEKASRLRQIIASRMVESLQSMAQLTTVVEVDVTRVVRLRARAKNDFAAREGVNLTFLPFFVLAATEALKEHPKVNGILEGNQITYHGEENVGIAVDTARGLVVPVIRGAGDLNLAGIARKIADLAARTRDNKVTPDELSGATFTVTNTGSGGALFDTPIVPAGTSAILGTGAIVKRPTVATDPDGVEYIAIRSMCYLALSYDHRLVDGADASRYLATVKKRIEAGDFESEVGL